MRLQTTQLAINNVIHPEKYYLFIIKARAPKLYDFINHNLSGDPEDWRKLMIHLHGGNVEITPSVERLAINYNININSDWWTDISKLMNDYDPLTQGDVVITNNEVSYRVHSLLLRGNFWKKQLSELWREDEYYINVSTETLNHYYDYIYTNKYEPYTYDTLIEMMQLSDIYFDNTLRNLTLDVFLDYLKEEYIDEDVANFLENWNSRLGHKIAESVYE